MDHLLKTIKHKHLHQFHHHTDEARDAYNPPLQFVNAARIANGDKPNTPAGPKTFPTNIPIPAPTINFPDINIAPFFNAFGAKLKLICEPIKNIKQAKIVVDAFDRIMPL